MRSRRDPDPGGEDLGDPAAPARTEHELSGVHATGEVEESGGDVVADDLVIGAAQAFDEYALLGEQGRFSTDQPVAARDMHRQEVGPLGPRGDARGPPDQRLAFRPAGKGDDHTLSCLPGLDDLVLGAVAIKLLVDLVRQPEERELAQRGEVADSEVVAERRVDLLWAVDVAVDHPPAQRFWRLVDQLHLVRAADDLVWDGLPLDEDRKSTRLNSSHLGISYAVFCLKKKK